MRHQKKAFDTESYKIIDILEDRRLNQLKNYFSKYSQKARNSVMNIVIDMYSPYITLIEELFSKAKILIDRFHLVQLINRSFNKSRINIMNKIKVIKRIAFGYRSFYHLKIEF